MLTLHTAQVWAWCCATLRQEETFTLTLCNTVEAPLGLLKSEPSWRWHRSEQNTDLSRTDLELLCAGSGIKC